MFYNGIIPTMYQERRGTKLSLSLTFHNVIGTLWARCGYVAFVACRAELS